MDTTSKLSFDIGVTNPTAGVSIAVWIDDQCIYDTSDLQQTHHLIHEINDQEGTHEMRVIMSGKTSDHTVIDTDGNILQDVMFTLGNFDIDGIAVDHLVQSKIKYQHDFNGTQPPITDTFHGFMGCNGTLSFEFTTPMYMWLFENM